MQSTITQTEVRETVHLTLDPPSLGPVERFQNLVGALRENYAERRGEIDEWSQRIEQLFESTDPDNLGQFVDAICYGLFTFVTPIQNIDWEIEIRQILCDVVEDESVDDLIERSEESYDRNRRLLQQISQIEALYQEFQILQANAMNGVLDDVRTRYAQLQKMISELGVKGPWNERLQQIDAKAKEAFQRIEQAARKQSTLEERAKAADAGLQESVTKGIKVLRKA